jgi:hypothetical protein
MNNQLFAEMEFNSTSSENIMQTIPEIPICTNKLQPNTSSIQDKQKTVTFNNIVQTKTLPISHPTSVPVPVPVPTSVPVPASVPVPTSVPVPASVPVPTSVPVPASIPVPVPASVPVPTSVPVPASVSVKTQIPSHLIKLGSFKCPKQTLVLFSVLILISFALYFSTREKKNKKTDEDENKK